jgi:magnesium transporter
MSRHNGPVIALVSHRAAATSTEPHPSTSTTTDGDDAALIRLQSTLDEAHQATSPGDPRRRAFTWISLDDASDAEIDEVANLVGLDDLLLEDALSPQQRAKVEVRTDELFMILKTLSWTPTSAEVETGQVAVFIGPGYAITRHIGEGFSTETIHARLHDNPDLRATGPISVAWAIADLAVDSYVAVGEAIEAEIESIEDSVFAAVPVDVATRIYRLNRENIEMRRAVRPLLPLAQRLTAGTQAGIPAVLVPFLRDIGDHLMRANDMVDAYDTTLMTMLMASTARQDLRQNQDMRKIAAWAAIIAVPTAIAGIYGMNFDEMPELHWSFGYPMVLTVMGVICVLLYRGFKKSGWV